MKNTSVNYDCPDCGANGYRWTGGCKCCAARKIAYLRSPDTKTSIKMQKAVLGGYRKEDQAEILDKLAQLDANSVTP